MSISHVWAAPQQGLHKEKQEQKATKKTIMMRIRNALYPIPNDFNLKKRK